VMLRYCLVYAGVEGVGSTVICFVVALYQPTQNAA
jgi:hypothetical protein